MASLLSGNIKGDATIFKKACLPGHTEIAIMALMASVQKGDPSAAIAILLNAIKQGYSPIHKVPAM